MSEPGAHGAGVVVVGGSLAGLRAAEQLRAAGHDGPLRVVGEEPHLPYNRPPLSKEVLGDPGDSDLERLHGLVAFRRRASVADVDFVLGARVEGSDLEARKLRLADGTHLGYDGLVVATGLRPRRLDLPGPSLGRYVIRTLDDVITLRLRLAGATDPRVVVVGGGFIGTETACTLLKLGCDVTVVEPFGAPMERVLGADLALAVQRHLTAQGVRFLTGVGVSGFTGEAHVAGVTLSDGRELPADLVVEAVGSVCNTEWLEGNPGLDLTDGVLCDDRLRVVGASRTVAVGDIARFPNVLVDDVPRRVEHWSIPTDTAKRAAPTLVALLRGEEPDTTPFVPVPSFWSDQLDLRFQSFGSPGLADEVELAEGDLDRLADGVLALYHRTVAGERRHVGTVAVNLPPKRQRELRAAFLQPDLSKGTR
ncbi:NAD(P)/FAD-dependent oxidoreductase [Nocardioides caldifontis]|uniref:NAD(P)/FAD-dependent oxidoreductase n=1 Tax=Nocardioides caldifontis TaxID=2588938 RepID=UPI0011E019C0|nr:NAD(P)/FAD-dependent oxidoreductase [Nocardioides caldifontis]